MKNNKMISIVFVSLLLIALSFITTDTFAMAQARTARMKNFYMMRDGKMVHMKSGKMMPVDKDFTMKNGTRCMTNGEYIMKNGEKMKLKDGEYMDMNGKTGMYSMMNENSKSTPKTKSDPQTMAVIYTCPMHPEIIRDKPGTCPKCGMKLVVKK